jgi:hypothetical protein
MVLRLKTRESRSSPGLPRPVSLKCLRYRASAHVSASSIAHLRVIEIFPSYTIVGSHNFVRYRFALLKRKTEKPPRVIPAAVFCV